MSKRRTTEEFINLAKELHGSKYDYSLVKYENKESKVDIICPLHGIFNQQANLHLKGSGCPKCSYIKRSLSLRKDKLDFIKEANMVHNNFYNYDKFNYVNSHVKSLITCPIHGDFLQSPNDHLQGKGCFLCRKSHLEEFIFSKLSFSNIKFEFQKHFEWLGKMSLDFYLLDYNAAIECHGKQHFGKGGWSKNFDFNSLYLRDELKNKLCLEHGINILYYCDDIKISNGFSLYNKKNIFDSFDELMNNIK